MPDISMCRNHECERKATCWRYMAPPAEYQCFGLFDHKDCKNYWPIEDATGPCCGNDRTQGGNGDESNT